MITTTISALTGIEAHYNARAFPYLNQKAIEKLFCRLYSRFVVLT